ncbi:hypothetical protein ACQZV8_05505 [Magnetococcales bacterium HHB-1]
MSPSSLLLADGAAVKEVNGKVALLSGISKVQYAVQQQFEYNFMSLDALQAMRDKPDTPLYNLRLSGDSAYYLSPPTSKVMTLFLAHSKQSPELQT